MSEQISYHSVIAIDGPAASGKTSAARQLAAKLGIAFVGTGSMYRAITLALLQRGISVENSEQINQTIKHELALNTGFEQTLEQTQEGWFEVDGHRASEEELMSEAVAAAVSKVASNPLVRETLVAHQRAFAQERPVVMEGRDIGTVVFAQSPFKFFITASAEARAQRRAAQGTAEDLQARDTQDKQRKHSPMTQAPDAEVIDNTHLNQEQTLAALEEKLTQKGWKT